MTTHPPPPERAPLGRERHHTLLYLASTSSSLEGWPEGLGAMTGPEVGGLRPLREGRPWASDNGAYSGRFSPERFARHLERLAPFRRTCLFVVAPDVPGDAAATLALWPSWRDAIRSCGFPAALVAQDGLEPKTMPECDALFLGGTDGWRGSGTARQLALEAERRGVWVHVGRVNSRRRLLRWAAFGARSFDGTYVAYRGFERGLGEVSGWLEAARSERAASPLLGPIHPRARG